MCWLWCRNDRGRSVWEMTPEEFENAPSELMGDGTWRNNRDTHGRMWSVGPFCEKEGVKTVLDLGTHRGRGSTYSFLKHGCIVTSVDVINIFDAPYPEEYFSRLTRLISTNANLTFPEGTKFDMVFIDTNHEHANTRVEIELA